MRPIARSVRYKVGNVSKGAPILHLLRHIAYLAPPSDGLYFGLYLWSGLLGTVMVVQFWRYAERLFTVAQGERLFGFLAAGGVLGAVAGAGVARVVVQLGDVSALLLGAAALFIATSFLRTHFSRRDSRRAIDEAVKKRPKNLRDRVHVLYHARD